MYDGKLSASPNRPVPTQPRSSAIGRGHPFLSFFSPKPTLHCTGLTTILLLLFLSTFYYHLSQLASTGRASGPHRGATAVFQQSQARQSRVNTWIQSPANLLLAGFCSAMLAGCQMAARGNNVQGVRAFQQGQHYAAIEHFQQALNTNPNSADAFYNLAATYHELGKLRQDEATLTQAENLYNQCLDLDGNHVDCRRGLAVLLVETQRSEKAFALLQQWAARSPPVAAAKVELARLYEEFGDKQTATSQLQEALSIDTNNSRAWTALASLRQESGHYSQALADYRRSYRLNSLQPAVARRIAALERSGHAGSDVTLPGGTRIVNTPKPSLW